MLSQRIERDEDGSLVIAMTVLLVLSLLTVGVLLRSTSSETQTRRNQDFNAALAGGDAGIADALYQLDQDKTGTFAKSNVSVGGGNEFSYQATQATIPSTGQVDPNSYIIHSVGTVNGVKHGVMVTAKRRQRFDYVMFANDRLDVNGACPDTFGPVGSAGIVTTPTNCTPEAHCFLPPSGIPAPTSNGCGDQPAAYGGNNPNPDGRHINETNPKPTVDETLDQFSGSGMSPIACPWESTGTITGAITGHANGYYLCNRTAGFTLSGSITVPNGQPVRIFLMTGTLSTVDGFKANVGGAAVNLQLYVKANSSLTLRGTGGSQAEFYGAMYAPTSYVEFSNAGSGVTFRGSLIARHIRVNGAPNLGYLDQSLQAITIESWKISDYKEVPSSCPVTSTTC